MYCTYRLGDDRPSNALGLLPVVDSRDLSECTDWKGGVLNADLGVLMYENAPEKPSAPVGSIYTLSDESDVSS
jgi:hypothetical protein